MEPISTSSIIDADNEHQNFVTIRENCLDIDQVQIVPQQSGQQQQQRGSPVENTTTVFKSPPPPPPQAAAAIVIPINRSIAEETASSVAEAHSTSVSSCSSFHNHSITNPIVISNHTPIQFNSEPQLSNPSNGPSNCPSTDKNNLSNDSNQTNVTQSSEGQQKKRKKSFKKAAKLDVKLKLEKSRQSARECRARKKLRYQYLEDLVCNREKAVMILRDELVKFCDIAKQLDSGSSITESSLRLIKEQAKENTHMDI